MCSSRQPSPTISLTLWTKKLKHRHAGGGCPGSHHQRRRQDWRQGPCSSPLGFGLEHGAGDLDRAGGRRRSSGHSGQVDGSGSGSVHREVSGMANGHLGASERCYWSCCLGVLSPEGPGGGGDGEKGPGSGVPPAKERREKVWPRVGRVQERGTDGGQGPR